MRALAAFLLAAAAAPQDVPKLNGWVTDQASLIEAGDRAAIEDLLGRYQAGSSGNEIAVLTVKDLGGRDIESYALAVARANGIGDPAKDNGALLVVALAERRIRIEVGRGLEGDLTDLVCGRIVDLVMRPEFRDGRPSQGIRRGVEALVAAAGGDLSAIPERSQDDPALGGAVIALLVLLFVVGLAARSARSRRGGGGMSGMGGMLTGMLLGQMLGGRGGRGGSGFGGLGSFHGGSRSSGGGFGGFGGSGGFGGGGASGGW